MRLHQPILKARLRISTILPIVLLVLGAVLSIHFLGIITVEQLAASLTALTMLGAALAFLFGLLQYQQGEKWRCRDYLAREMKDFFADPMVTNALLMVDWSVRRINLNLDDEPQSKWPAISRSDQIQALYPHVIFPARMRLVRREAEESEDTEDQYAAFSPTEARIRDAFDVLFDRMGAFESLISEELVSVSDLRPYLGYWIEDIADAEAPPEDLRWTLMLFGYINFYKYAAVVRLFEHFGHEISPGGKTWNAIEEKVGDPQLATMLRSAIGVLDSAAAG